MHSLSRFWWYLQTDTNRVNSALGIACEFKHNSISFSYHGRIRFIKKEQPFDVGADRVFHVSPNAFRLFTVVTFPVYCLHLYFRLGVGIYRLFVDLNAAV